VIQSRLYDHGIALAFVPKFGENLNKPAGSEEEGGGSFYSHVHNNLWLGLLLALSGHGNVSGNLVKGTVS
jgi:hypothetical protein